PDDDAPEPGHAPRTRGGLHRAHPRASTASHDRYGHRRAGPLSRAFLLRLPFPDQSLTVTAGQSRAIFGGNAKAPRREEDAKIKFSWRSWRLLGALGVPLRSRSAVIAAPPRPRPYGRAPEISPRNIE